MKRIYLSIDAFTDNTHCRYNIHDNEDDSIDGNGDDDDDNNSNDASADNEHMDIWRGKRKEGKEGEE